MPSLSIMIKPASSLCNLRCEYCFYHSLSKSRENFSFGVMDEKTIDILLQKAIEFCDGDSIFFTFQGGEPLIAGKSYYRYFVKKVKELNKNNCTIFYGLQTNGTLIDEDWARFFKDNNFLLGVSLDGDKTANKFRVKENGQSSFDDVNNSLAILDKYKVEYNILIVTTGYTADHIEEVYKYHTSVGHKFLQFIPCLRPFNDKSESELYMTVEQYSQFLTKLFKLYVNDYVTGNYTSVRQMDNLVHLFLGHKVEQCGVCGHCSHQFVVEGNGNVYPCDFYCTDEWLLGNIKDNDFKYFAYCDKAIDFIKESFVYPEKCKTCRYFQLCRGGGCKRNREDRDYCEAYKKFFNLALPLFKVFL